MSQTGTGVKLDLEVSQWILDRSKVLTLSDFVSVSEMSEGPGECKENGCVDDISGDKGADQSNQATKHQFEVDSELKKVRTLSFHS